MGNIISDGLGKIASNITQSVISALIVTAVTTYIIVSPGKKDDAKDAAAKDSAKVGTSVTPVEKSRVDGAAGQNVSQSPGAPRSLENTDAGTSVMPRGQSNAVALPATEKKVPPSTAEAPVTKAATKTYQELPQEQPTEDKLEPTISQGRAKGDSLLNAHPQVNKAKDVRKEEKKEAKDVKKRSDEVFDELDQDTQK